MTKYFLFSNLLFLLFATFPLTALSASKKYRYIKREHGVRFAGAFPTNFSSAGVNMSAMLRGAYTYNWKGMLEAGPYFHANANILQAQLNSWGAGILAEYNIIKNRGKRKLVPAVGLTFGLDHEGAGATPQLSAGLQVALKIFVGKRTPFIVTLGYSALTPMNAPIQGGVSHKLNPTMGFSYYFDFY